MVNQNNQIKISAETRRSIFDKIMSHADFLGVFQGGNYEDQNIVDFLKMIWDLPAMPSEDPRFKNAEADARQHLINNYCCPLKVSEQRDIHPQCCCNGIADDFSEGKPLS